MLKSKVVYICKGCCQITLMNWLAEILEWVFNVLMFEPLEWMEWTPNIIFIGLLIFGLAYWTFYWQPKYNREADVNSDQIK